MLTKTPIGNRFYNWVVSQNPDQRYQWCNNGDCACGLFLREELGLSRDEARDAYHAALFPRSDRVGKAEAKKIWSLFNQIAQGSGYDSWTFGALGERIRHEMPEYV